MRFAQVEARLALMKLVYHFRFALAAPSTEDPLPIRAGITLSPRDGMHVTVAVRNKIIS
jgi:cytochrome P450